MNRMQVEQYLSGKFGNEDDEQKRLAQAQVNENMLAAGLGRAGSTIGDAFSGTKSDQSFYDNMEANASAPMDTLKANEAKQMQIAQYLQGRFDKEDQSTLAESDRTRKHEQSLAEMNYQKTRDAKSDQFKEQSLALQRAKMNDRSWTWASSYQRRCKST